MVTSNDERQRFTRAVVSETLRPVGSSDAQQQAAWVLIARGWCGYGSDRVELIGRPAKSRDGGRLFGRVGREEVVA